MKMVNLVIFLLASLLLAPSQQTEESGYCTKYSQTCSGDVEENSQKYLFYDVNPPEGFNLRRDVFMRFAIMMAQAHRNPNKSNWNLVLPPWYNLYHWGKERTKLFHPVPWQTFFDVDSLKKFAPVMEFNSLAKISIDTLYVLQNYDDPFEGGSFKEKWEINKGECNYYGYWGYDNVTAKEVICVRFQGKISKLWEIMNLHPNDKQVMFAHGEIPLHDTYGNKAFWDCRKSMKFNSDLIKIAQEFIKNVLKCSDECSYLSVHWRRGDFARSRSKDVPSIEGTAKQVDKTIKKNNLQIDKLFIATDATDAEKKTLKKYFSNFGYEVHYYRPKVENKLHPASIAIIEQIVCSYASFFIGTHESTYSYRIQEEREILGFKSGTTFNRLCPDKGHCERPSKWTIVH